MHAQVGLLYAGLKLRKMTPRIILGYVDVKSPHELLWAVVA